MHRFAEHVQHGRRGVIQCHLRVIQSHLSVLSDDSVRINHLGPSPEYPLGAISTLANTVA